MVIMRISKLGRYPPPANPNIDFSKICTPPSGWGESLEGTYFYPPCPHAPTWFSQKYVPPSALGVVAGGGYPAGGGYIPTLFISVIGIIMVIGLVRLVRAFRVIKFLRVIMGIRL